MGKLSREKGKLGEREVVALIKEHGFDARRGQQFRGGSDSPDVIHNMLELRPAGLSLAVEVKRRERVNLHEALAQCSKDADDFTTIPVVFHRKDRHPWMVTLDASDFLEIIYCMHNYEEVERGET